MGTKTQLNRVFVIAIGVILVFGTMGSPARVSSAQSNANFSLVSFTGKLDIDSAKAKKSYSGYGEVKNNSAQDATTLKGTVILYWKGTSVATDSVEFPTTEVKAGESVPFIVYVSDINFFLDVDDAKFSFDGVTTPTSIYVPPLTFTESKATLGRGSRVIGKVSNRGPESVEDAVAIISFYDATGKFVSFDREDVLPTVAFTNRVPSPVLNAGWGVNVVLVDHLGYEGPTRYKVTLRGKKSTQQSQLLQVSNVSLKAVSDYEKHAIGTVANSSNRTVSQVYFVFTPLDAGGKPTWVEREFLYQVNAAGNFDALPLSPGQSRPFDVRLFASSTEGAVSVDVVAFSFDRYEGPAVGPTPIPIIPTATPTPLGETCHKFQETGKSVCGTFLTYWQGHGGISQQGFPISLALNEVSDTDGKTYSVQYFERAVFERHPENAPPYDILLSLIGSFEYKRKYPQGAPGQQPNNSAGSRLFAETGKRLGGRFLQYWDANGGLAQQGLPISDEFSEKSNLDGKIYRVQYFERAVFELHPENAAPFDVLLSQLGTFQYNRKHP